MELPDVEGLFDENGVPIFDGGDSFDMSEMGNDINWDAVVVEDESFFQEPVFTQEAKIDSKISAAEARSRKTAVEAEAKARKAAEEKAAREDLLLRDAEIKKQKRIEQILNREPHPGEAIHAKVKSGELRLEDLSAKEYSQWENLLADQASEHGGFPTAHGSKAMVQSSPLPQAAEEVLATKSTPFRNILNKANTRGMAALEQTMDLVADISQGAKTGNAVGAIGDFIPQTMSNLKPVVQNIKNHSTAQHIIEGMKVAQGKVSGMSRGKQAAIGIGSLAGIGAISNRNLKERRG